MEFCVFFLGFFNYFVIAKLWTIANFTLQCKTVCTLNNAHKPKDMLHNEKYEYIVVNPVLNGIAQASHHHHQYI